MKVKIVYAGINDISEIDAKREEVQNLIDAVKEQGSKPYDEIAEFITLRSEKSDTIINPRFIAYIQVIK